MLVKKQHTNRMLAAPRITGPPGSPVVGSRFRKPSIEIGRYGGHLFFCKDILNMQKARLLEKMRRLGAIIIKALVPTRAYSIGAATAPPGPGSLRTARKNRVPFGSAPRGFKVT